ncbi:MAG TPA: CAP domain-containing protein [Pyrinomonadaceae bacterium]|nr:CAP domain-containing protein [Pyrinomonadaceae bacterium]
MTWKFKFSRIVLFTILFTFFVTAVSAQRVRIQKSATGRVASNQPIRQETRRETRGSLSSDELQIHYLVNNERRKKGLSDLYWDEDLAKMARAYSKKMARESFFSHFDGDGNSVINRAEDSNIGGWNKIGENLFFCEGYDDFDALAVRGWMNSAEHRRNILDRQFTTTGIGVAQTRDGRIYITQVFIRN